MTVQPSVEKQLARIPNPDRGRILRAIEALSDDLTGDVRPLVGRGGYRLRVGKWRLLMSIDEELRQVSVEALGPRGDVYK
ncbi:hypothetical protein [uncultured Fretibacterium sp.]|uniref:type II toxin-antitoxin system RelE family toxin n=1 Tax=uncultured Fretibacterium sp. TaxID=1678694 RepID=UPI00261CC8F7|nr:hypothetical protein [uncultured Fretibacterium sp.]